MKTDHTLSLESTDSTTLSSKRFHLTKMQTFSSTIFNQDISSTEMENPENVFNKGRWTLWALEVEQAPSCLSAQIPATNQPTHQLKNNIRNHLLVAPKLLNYSRPWNLKLFFLPQSRRNSNILPTDYYKIRSPS